MNRQMQIAQLERQIERLRSTPDPTYYCAGCGMEMDDWLLTDVTVVVADGEEGYSNVTCLLCNDCLEKAAEALAALGFIDHRHGSTSTLEDLNCPGFTDMQTCPTPTHYGNVTWGRNPPQDPELE